MLRPLLLLTMLLAAVPARATVLTLDAMTDLLPYNPCLQQPVPVLFTGTWCEGVCPPDVPTGWCNQGWSAIQSYLPGVLQDPLSGYTWVRWTELHGVELDQPTWARVDPETRRLVVSIPRSHGGTGLYLRYGISDEGAVDPVGAGAGAFGFVFEGDITPARPLMVNLILDARWGQCVADLSVTAPGPLIVPFSAIPCYGEFDFRALRRLEMTITENGGTFDWFDARRFSIGPITFEPTGATPAHRRSWGTLKTHYR